MQPRNLLAPTLLLGALALLWMAGSGSWSQAAGTDQDRQTAPERADRGPWSRPAQEEIRRRLTPRQYQVTQEDDTEPPFRNAYWNHNRAGIYVDIVTGEPLFSSLEKFESGTGWPSFHSPLEPDLIVEREDHKLWMRRIEVRSRHGDSHLGHVFDDGPGPTGLRYCINSAALRFIPASDLVKEGYGKYVGLFEKEQRTSSSTR